MRNQDPVQNRVYALEQVFKGLNLRGSPSLVVKIDGQHDDVIQRSHVVVTALLLTPGWAETRWEFLFETNEGIPVFRAVNDLAALIDVEPFWFSQDPYAFWVTPKAFPHEQPRQELYP